MTVLLQISWRTL